MITLTVEELHGPPYNGTPLKSVTFTVGAHGNNIVAGEGGRAATAFQLIKNT